MQVDTSQRDLGLVDKMLTSVKTKKKQLEKLQKQLDGLYSMWKLRFPCCMIADR